MSAQPPAAQPVDSAERRAEYWKAEHNAANELIAEYQAMLQEASDIITDYCDHMGAPYPDALFERIAAALKEG